MVRSKREEVFWAVRNAVSDGFGWSEGGPGITLKDLLNYYEEGDMKWRKTAEVLGDRRSVEKALESLVRDGHVVREFWNGETVYYPGIVDY